MKKKKSKKNLKHKFNFKNFYSVLAIIFLLISIMFIGLIFKLDVLPINMFLPIFIIILIVNFIIVFLLIKRNVKKKIKKVFSVIATIIILIMIVISFYLYKTLGFFWSINSGEYKIEKYSVLVLKDSKITEVKDLKGKNVGYYTKSTGYKTANQKLKKQVSVDSKSYDDLMELGEALLNSDIDAILIENSMKSVIEEQITDFASNVREIYTFSIKIKVESSVKDVNVTAKPFTIYISGIDSYGEISTVSRSDVNMIMVVNPTTKQILLVSIPRDYYVQLSGTTGTRDKLTHAGLYGVEKSISTIEDLIGVDINYYFKVNFTSVVDIVNALGKIEVYSDYNFVSEDNYKYTKGFNTMNGEQALSFARERHAFADGDRQRGKDQQAVINAIITKLSSKSIITKYTSLLDSINGKFQTNMGTDKMTSLIKMQLKDMAKWNVTSFSLNGADGSEPTYSGGSQRLYVMLPYKDSITQAKQLIDSVINGKMLEGSYVEYDGSSALVVQPSKKTPTSTTPSTSENSDNLKNTFIITVYDEKKQNPKSQTVNEGDSLNPIYQPIESKKFKCWKDINTDEVVSLTNIKMNMEIYPYYEDENSDNDDTDGDNKQETGTETQSSDTSKYNEENSPLLP